MPGIAEDTTSSAPDFDSRFDTRFEPWSSRYSTRAKSGVTVRARTPGRQLAFFVVEGVGLPKAAPRPLLPSISTMSARKPAAAAICASVAATVVLPTPPFPATMSTRAWVQNPAVSTSCNPPTVKEQRMRKVVAAVAASLMALGGLLVMPAPARAESDRPIRGGHSDQTGCSTASRPTSGNRPSTTPTRDAGRRAGRAARLDRARCCRTPVRPICRDAIEAAETPIAMWVGPARNGTGRRRQRVRCCRSPTWWASRPAQASHAPSIQRRSRRCCVHRRWATSSSISTAGPASRFRARSFATAAASPYREPRSTCTSPSRR